MLLPLSSLSLSLSLFTNSIPLAGAAAAEDTVSVLVYGVTIGVILLLAIVIIVVIYVVVAKKSTTKAVSEPSSHSHIQKQDEEKGLTANDALVDVDVSTIDDNETEDDVGEVTSAHKRVSRQPAEEDI